MTESQFIEENKEKWLKLEAALKNDRNDPDYLNRLFRKVSGDLSYAQTHFPRRSVRFYLNSLVGGVFESMKTKKPIRLLNSILNFYKHTLPAEIIRSRNAFLVSFLVFFASVMVGVYSTYHYPEFANTILGSHYVAMTEENIAKNDPMAVYKDPNDVGMFLRITLNNIKVAFIAFILGLFTPIGTMILLIRNGVMLGVFQTFFYTKGLLLPSFLTIWIHGTIEISSIVVAGAAGILIGNALINPGTYTRIQSLKFGASRAMILLLSTVPLFVIAGFFESFITRLTHWPDMVKVFIIGGSLLFILGIYVIYPIYYYRKGRYTEQVPYTLSRAFDDSQNTINGSTMFAAISKMRLHLEPFLFQYLLPISVSSIVIVYLLSINAHVQLDTENQYLDGSLFSLKLSSLPFVVWMVIITLYFFSFMHLLENQKSTQITACIKNIIKHPLAYLFSSLMALVPVFVGLGWSIVLFIFMPYAIGFIVNYYLEDGESDLTAIRYAAIMSIRHWTDILVLNLILFIILFIGSSVINMILQISIFYVVNWMNIFETRYVSQMFYSTLLPLFNMILIAPLIYFLYTSRLINIFNDKYSSDIADRIEAFKPSNQK